MTATDLHELRIQREQRRRELDTLYVQLAHSRAVLHQLLRARRVDDRRGFKLDTACVEALETANDAQAAYDNAQASLQVIQDAIGQQVQEQQPPLDLGPTGQGGPVGGWH